MTERVGRVGANGMAAPATLGLGLELFQLGLVPGLKRDRDRVRVRIELEEYDHDVGIDVDVGARARL